MNVRRMAVLIGLSFIVLPGGTWANTIRGTVSVAPGADPDPAIVWLTGAVDGEQVSTKPMMSQRGATFSPAFLVAVAGQPLEMPNDDNIAHNVFSYSPGNEFNLGIYPKGTSKTVTFDSAGLVDIFCSIHRNMSAQILVVPNNFYAIAGSDGTFELSGVPAGDYTLKAYAKDHAEHSAPVSVSASGPLVLNITLKEE